jgi:acyl carrier protein
VSAAAAAGAKSLLLLAQQPLAAQEAAQLAGLAAGQGLALVLALLDADVIARPQLLRYAVLTACQGMLCLGSILSTAAAAAAAAEPAAEPSSSAAGAGSSGQQGMEDLVRSAVAEILGLDPRSADISASEPLMSLGVSSSAAVQLVARLEPLVNAQLPATLVFDYPTICDMAEYLAVNAGGLPLIADTPATAAATAAAAADAAAAGLVRSALAEVLGADVAGQVSEEEPLMSAGLTSTSAVQLTGALEAALGQALPATLVFDYPSVRDMAEYLAGSCSLAAQAAATAAAAAAPAAAVASPAAGDVSAVVRAALAEILGADVAGQISDAEPLMSSGLTSTSAVQLTSSLEARLGAQLPPTLVFDYPSIADIHAFLEESLGGGAAAAAAAAAEGALSGNTQFSLCGL